VNKTLLLAIAVESGVRNAAGQLGPNVVVGSGAVLEDNARISNATIGRNVCAVAWLLCLCMRVMLCLWCCVCGVVYVVLCMCGVLWVLFAAAMLCLNRAKSRLRQSLNWSLG
jgi:hypothetical protein